MSMFEKHFSIDEANGLLPHVAAVFEKIHSIREELGQRRDELEKLHRALPGNGGSHTSVDFLTSSETIASMLGELQEEGIQVKDIDIGLVDFPHMRGQDEVLLCWKLGEKSIGFWHDVDSGYQGRQPL